jgi:hypothetical protein
LPASNRQGRQHQPKASGRGGSTDSRAVRPGDDDPTLRAAIERVVLSRTTIEIELAEGMTSDDQNRILIIPWTPPSPHRRREIIQGGGDRPFATRPMRTEARAALTDALRDAHYWLDELITRPTKPSNRSPRAKAKPNVGSAERSRSLSFAPPSSKRRSKVDCLAALGSSA